MAFEISFMEMTQKNTKTRFIRAINRVELTPAKAPAVHADVYGDDYLAIDVSHCDLEPGLQLGTMLPDDLQGADDRILILVQGQLVQQHSIRDDGWAFGTVVYSDDDSNSVQATPLGFDRDTGWFRITHTEAASSVHLSKLQANLGQGALAALETPSTWAPVKDPMVAERFQLGAHTQEFATAEAYFKKSLRDRVKIVGIVRIQNTAMWQSYAMQRQIMAQRDHQKDAEAAETKWLFHGTAADTIPKIVQQGFNRGFAGKNATMYASHAHWPTCK